MSLKAIPFPCNIIPKYTFSQKTALEIQVRFYKTIMHQLLLEPGKYINTLISAACRPPTSKVSEVESSWTLVHFRLYWLHFTHLSGQKNSEENSILLSILIHSREHEFDRFHIFNLAGTNSSGLRRSYGGIFILADATIIRFR